MSSEWPLRKISDVADFLNSKRVPLKSLDREKLQGEFPYYGASGIVDYIDDYLFDGTFLLISEDGENLRSRKTPIAFKASGKFWVNNHAHILAEKEEGILDYLEYYFSMLDLTPYITGAVQPKLNKANLDSIEIPIPPKDERLNINRVLNSFTDKLELNRQINQTLEEMAQAIFKSWFVDFEPVKAKIKAKQAGGNAEQIQIAAMCAISGKTEQQLKNLPKETQTQLKTTANLFPEAMQDSELGEIPEGWSNFKMVDLVKHIKPGTNYQPKRQETGIPFVNGKHVQNGFLDFSKEVKYISKEEYERVHKKWKPEANDVLITRIGTLGRVGIVTEYDLPMALHYNSINIKEDVLKHPFIFFLLKSDYFQYYYHLYKKQAVQEFVTIDAVEGIEINLPKDFTVLDNLTSVFDSLFLKLKENHFEGNTLVDLRDCLLPKLLSGKMAIDANQTELVAASG